jgi:hypothetical protein|tara:strand:- start:30 stop:233 length:204 start_codon:yes stop_codon:yes gene_type:complete
MLSKFTDVYQEFPARIFNTIAEAQVFTAMLARLEISHRVILDTPPKRLKLPIQTIVILLDGFDGIRH